MKTIARGSWNLMLDFETLGTTPDTQVLSLGAVVFDAEGEVDARYWVFNAAEQRLRKRACSVSTIAWWQKQPPAARAVFDAADSADALTVNEILDELTMWLKDYPRISVWGNGATFDVSIAEDLYRSSDRRIPWHFAGVRCYRTIKALYHIEAGHTRTGTHHNALDDARYQAKCLAAYMSLRGVPEQWS